MTISRTVKLQKLPARIHARWLPPLQDTSPYDQGFARGYGEGWKKAQEDARRELEERVRVSRAHWDAVAQSVQALPGGLIQKLREQLVQLAFAAVKRILAATPVTREEVAAQVNQLLEQAESGAEIEAQLNPADLELLTAEDRGALWKQEFKNLKWTANPAIPRGGCLLTGAFGWMDGRREAQVKKLEDRALESVKQTPS